MTRVVIINCFDTYEHRVDVLHRYFRQNGYNVSVIASDFRHIHKSYRTEKKEDYIYIHAGAYNKNISVRRMLSHKCFAKKAFSRVREEKPDLLYVLVPPNSMVKQAVQYKKEHPSVRLILDLIDLWPETMPLDRYKNLLPFRWWKEMRDKHLRQADYVITECNLYKEVLKKKLDLSKTGTLYLPGPPAAVSMHPQIDEHYISLCYLGSINNIIDIQLIGRIIKQLCRKKPVRLHIIGDGEKKEELIGEAEQSGAAVVNHGKSFDTQKKQEIFDKCDFGLNIMKTSVCVGLTMKSMDYFAGGLPILNNIGGDTKQFVETYGIGINLDPNGEFQYRRIEREHVKLFYEKHLTEKVFAQNLQQILNGMGV